MAVMLCSYSSSAQAPYLVKDMNPGSENGISWVTDFECSEGLYFYIATTVNEGSELWRSDGTESGTFFVKDIDPDNANEHNVNDIFPFNGGALFGAEELAEENSDVLIYPNPADNQFTVEFGRLIESGYVQLYDLNMKLLYEAPISQMNQLNITTRLSAGTYFVKVADGDNSTIQKVQIF